MKKAAGERILHRIAIVHGFLELWQGNQNLCDTLKESQAQTFQMTILVFILDVEGIIKESWSLFRHDSAVAFKLSQRSLLPPALFTKDLHGGGTQILNVRRIPRINHHPVQSNQDSRPECLSDTEHRLHVNGDLDHPNVNK
jgi:hypothetical protein